MRRHGAMIPVPQYIFLSWCLVKQRDKFTFFKNSIGGKWRKKFSNSIKNNSASKYLDRRVSEVKEIRGCIQKFPDWPPPS
jgi:hypothetical protein